MPKLRLDAHEEKKASKNKKTSQLIALCNLLTRTGRCHPPYRGDHDYNDHDFGIIVSYFTLPSETSVIRSLCPTREIMTFFPLVNISLIVWIAFGESWISVLTYFTSSISTNSILSQDVVFCKIKILLSHNFL